MRRANSTAAWRPYLAVFLEATRKAARLSDGWTAPPARPLIPLTAAFTLGIAAETFLLVGPLGWIGIVGLALLGAAAAWWLRSHRVFWLLAILSFFCVGGQAAAVAFLGNPPHHLSRLPEELLASPVRLEGWVSAPPDPQPAEAGDAGDPEWTRFTVEVTRLQADERWVNVTGRARLTVAGAPLDVAYGDEVRGLFQLRHPRKFRNPGAFDYPAYLATRGIFLEGWAREPLEIAAGSRGSPMLSGIFHLRRLLLRRLEAAMPASQAALLRAVVLGDRSGLTPSVNQRFLDSGTYHILAISGLNVSLLAGTLFGFFRLLRLSSRVGAAAAALLVTGYAVLAGAGPSVVRAAVMADVYLAAVVLDRRADLLNSLALSALLLLWWNPRFLGDVGFQLTYLATLGIILVLPHCQASLQRFPRPLRFVGDSVAITLAATVMTLPVLAGAFNRVAPVSIAANIAIVPVSGMITALGVAASAAFAVLPSGLSWLNVANGWLADLLVALAGWFASWPWSSVRVYTPMPGMVIAYYAGVAACVLAAASRGRQARLRRRWACWLALACALLLAGQVVHRLFPGQERAGIRLTLLDVGQGEAILIEAPGKRRMLVDTGGLPGMGPDTGLQVVAPYLWHEWIGRLDVLVLTHPERDHVGGVPAVLRTFEVGEVWSGEITSARSFGVWVQEYLRLRKIPLRIVAAGSPVLRWGDTAVEVLHPGGTPGGDMPAGGRRRLSANDQALVLRISLGDRTALLTSDIEREGEAALLRDGGSIRAQVLTVPHHGSRTSSTWPFLDAVRPEVALLSVGYRNRYHHPHPEVLDRYATLGIRLLRTDRDGAIRVEMNHGRVWAHPLQE